MRKIYNLKSKNFFNSIVKRTGGKIKYTQKTFDMFNDMWSIVTTSNTLQMAIDTSYEKQYIIKLSKNDRENYFYSMWNAWKEMGKYLRKSGIFYFQRLLESKTIEQIKVMIDNDVHFIDREKGIAGDFAFMMYNDEADEKQGATFY